MKFLASVVFLLLSLVLGGSNGVEVPFSMTSSIEFADGGGSMRCLGTCSNFEICLLTSVGTTTPSNGNTQRNFAYQCVGREPSFATETACGSSCPTNDCALIDFDDDSRWKCIGRFLPPTSNFTDVSDTDGGSNTIQVTIRPDPWWDLVNDNFVGTRLKRCFKRKGVPPVEGSRCARRPKTCFFGTHQECPARDGTRIPATRCFCDGERGDQTWKCGPMDCSKAQSTAVFD